MVVIAQRGGTDKHYAAFYVFLLLVGQFSAYDVDERDVRINGEQKFLVISVLAGGICRIQARARQKKPAHRIVTYFRYNIVNRLAGIQRIGGKT